jgi:hypothetical protein
LISGAVMGIDAGFSMNRKSSAACVLGWTKTGISWTLARYGTRPGERETVLRRLSADVALTAVAIDGPLRRGFDRIGVYRRAEAMLTRRLWRTIGKPGQSSSPVGLKLNEAANEDAKCVASVARVAPARHNAAIDDLAIVEAFPNSFLGLMIERPEDILVTRGDRSDRYYVHAAGSSLLEKLVARFLPGRALPMAFQHVTNHDERAAMVCALTALCVAFGDYTAVGDGNGWIILPPRSFIAEAHWRLLAANDSEFGDTSLLVSKGQDAAE